MLANLDKRQSLSNYIETLTAGNFTSIEISGNMTCYYATICGSIASDTISRTRNPRKTDNCLSQLQEQGYWYGQHDGRWHGASFELFEV